MNKQELSDKRSLDLHREIVKRLRHDQSLWEKPLSNIERWTNEKGQLPVPYVIWKVILTTEPRDKIIKIMLSKSQRSTQLRSSSPFVGILDQETRDKIFKKYSKER